MKGTEGQRDGAIIIVVIAVIVFVIRYPSLLFPPQVKDIPFTSMNSGPVIVSIRSNMGVNGIFYLPEKARVSELLEAAGFANREMFDHRTISLPLSTGKTVFLESHNTVIIEEMKNADKLALGIPIDINHATIEDLMLINGIGEKTALQIVQFREESGRYHKVEDLMKIRGIKEKRFRNLRRYFYVDDVL
jgi:competence ComEA-like helix-hairpin-helix protein